MLVHRANKRLKTGGYPKDMPSAQHDTSQSDSREPSNREMSWLVCLASAIIVGAIFVTPQRPRMANAADPEFLQGKPPEALQRSLPVRVSPLDEALEPERLEMPAVGGIVPTADMEKVEVRVSKDGRPQLGALPKFDSNLGSQSVALTRNSNFVFFTINPELQKEAERLTKSVSASHVAIVAMNVKTGAVLAIASKSSQIPNLALHAGFPAASLFKVVTAAAAVEQANVDAETPVNFRGGTYTLSESNYLPDARRDRRVMTIGEALGRSCNPVFGQIGLKYLNGDILQRYARLFGFNTPLGFEAPLADSHAIIPTSNPFQYSRTAAGFGDVGISPVHAAALMSGIANGGLLPRPTLVDRIVRRDGSVVFRTTPEAVQRIIQPATAATLMSMMEYTTTMGTSRREFMVGNRPVLGDIQVVAKTGTLSGTNPKGLNSWFIGAAPAANPEIAIAVVAVDPRLGVKSSHLARLMMQSYFGVQPIVQPVTPRVSAAKRWHGKKSYAVKRTSSKYRSIPAKKAVGKPATRSPKKKK